MAWDPPLRDEDLHAYVDGELDQQKHKAITRQLLQSDDAVSKVTAWQDQNRAIRAAFSSVVFETLPPSMIADQPMDARQGAPLRFIQLHCPARAPASPCVHRGFIYAAFVLGALTALCVMLACQQFPFAFLTQSASGIDMERDSARRTIAALESFTQSRGDARQATLAGAKPSLILPSLASQGFALSGVRIFANSVSNLACLFYSQSRLSPLALCVEGAAGDDPTLRTTGSFPNVAVYWRQKGASYALSGPLPERDLRHLAEAIAPEIESFYLEPNNLPNR